MPSPSRRQYRPARHRCCCTRVSPPGQGSGRQRPSSCMKTVGMHAGSPAMSRFVRPVLTSAAVAPRRASSYSPASCLSTTDTESGVTDDVLDNPIWNALCTAHARFAHGGDLARRYPASVTPLAAMAVPTAAAYEALAGILQPERTAALFLPAPPTLPDGWQLERATPVWQMVWTGDGGEVQEFPMED